MAKATDLGDSPAKATSTEDIDEKETSQALDDIGTGTESSVEGAKDASGDDSEPDANTETDDEIAEVQADAPDEATDEAPDETQTGSEDDPDLPDGAPADDAGSADPDVDDMIAPPPAQPTVVERRGGFVPTVLGGLVAAVLGFGLSQYLGPNGWPFSQSGTEFESHAEARMGQIEAAQQDLAARVDATEGALDAQDLGRFDTGLSDAETARGALSAQVTDAADQLSALQAQLLDLGSRIGDLEKRPVTESVSPEAIAAYEQELTRLQAAMADQRAGIEDLISAQNAQMDDIAAQAAAKEDSARAEADRAAANAALSRITAALETGQPYQSALDALEQTGSAEIPAALRASAADGVMSSIALRDAFPATARAALAAARSADPDGETRGGIAGFLREQLGARSVQPREGTSADAVLSRAEAAVRDGRLNDALAEIETLPDAARGEMATWASRASARLDALAAARALADNLNS